MKRKVLAIGFGVWLVTGVCSGEFLWLDELEEEYGVTFSEEALTMLRKAGAERVKEVCGSAAEPSCRELIEEDALRAVKRRLGELDLPLDGRSELGPEDIKGIRLNMREYGKMILSSIPSKAKAYLEAAREGETPLVRIYPVGGYTLLLKKDGCKNKSVPVSIQPDATSKEEVILDCEE